MSSQITKDEQKEGSQLCRDHIKSEIDNTVQSGHKRHQEAVNQLRLQNPSFLKKSYYWLCYHVAK